jgi:hypothetical protein
MDSWNAIGKHWLQKYDKKFGVDFFLCKCSDIKGLDIASIPKYYQDAIQALIINKGIIVFIPYIVYFKYIISQKRLKKKWISIKFDLRVTKYVFI